MDANARIKGPVTCAWALTTSRPVTFTMSDATDGEEGCASRVVTLCCTFWKGNDCVVAKDEIRIGVCACACACGWDLKVEKKIHC